MRVFLRRLLRYPVVPGLLLFLFGLWQAGRAVLWWIYGAWNFYDFVVSHFGPVPLLEWLVSLPGKPWFPAAALTVGLVWVVAGLKADAVLKRAQTLAPTLRDYIGLSNRIQREMINEPDKRNSVGRYATRIEQEWRKGLGEFLNRELPAATHAVLEKLGPANAPPFEWEFYRLQLCTVELKKVLANLDYWIGLSRMLREPDRPST